MASGIESTFSSATKMNSKDPASKRKKTTRLAKLKQCKLEDWRKPFRVQEKKQGDETFNAAENPCVNDPGEVLNPDFVATVALLPVSWASLLNSSSYTERRTGPPDTQLTARFSRTQEEPDPDLQHASSCLRIIRPESRIFASFNECGNNADVPTKLCEDRSPKSKASKMGKGSRRTRKNRCNSKENECTVAEQRQTKVRLRKLETRASTHLQDRPYCYSLESEDGWKAAVDVLGLHSAVKKPSSGVLQLKVTPCNDQQQEGINAAPLLGTKAARKPGFERSVHRMAWMRNDVHLPMSSLRIPRKHGGLYASSCLSDPSDKPQCPICTEDLDSTDTLFDSCPCGFRLCLFCYHKIAVENGNCPACRGVYIKDISAKPAVLLPR